MTQPKDASARAREPIAAALDRTLMSPNECDSNGEIANVVDGLFAIARGLHAVADALSGATERHRRDELSYQIRELERVVGDITNDLGQVNGTSARIPTSEIARSRDRASGALDEIRRLQREGWW
jgi:hypothetical protein